MTTHGAYPCRVLAAVALVSGVGNRANVRAGKAARALLVWMATPRSAAAAESNQNCQNKILDDVEFSRLTIWPLHANWWKEGK